MSIPMNPPIGYVDPVFGMTYNGKGWHYPPAPTCPGPSCGLDWSRPGALRVDAFSCIEHGGHQVHTCQRCRAEEWIPAAAEDAECRRRVIAMNNAQGTMTGRPLPGEDVTPWPHPSELGRGTTLPSG